MFSHRNETSLGYIVPRGRLEDITIKFEMFVYALLALNFFVIFSFALRKTNAFSTLYGSCQLFLVLQFTYLIIFLRWVNKMVDVVTNRVFETFTRVTPGENVNSESLKSISSLKRFSSDQKLKRILAREAEAKARNSQLFDIKENAPELILPKKRPLMGLSCHSCTPASRNSLVKKTTEQLALKNVIEFQPSFRKKSLLHRAFPQLMQLWEFKRFEYPQVVDKVLQDDRLKHAIEKTALQQFQDSPKSDDDFYQKLLKNNERRARKILTDMRSTLSDFLLKFTAWVLYKLLPCFLSSVVVHPGQVQMLKDAGSTSLPLIFLPLHRSHLDYILISFILLNNNVRAPLVAAGDNLRIPFFGSLLRGLGAFFIKRRIDPIMGRKDHVYKAVLHTYMNECLRAGHNVEFFLEGGRTRTGKPCMPKYGILSVIVESFMDGTIEDALLVPVSVNYEKLVDGNFVREQLGQPKEMETFGAAIKGIWHVLNSNYGMMRIDFNQPFSLRELVKTFNTNGKIPTLGSPSIRTLKSNPSTTSLYGTDVVSDEHKSLVESISKHVIFDCANSTSVMSTNALAFILLYLRREGATLEQLVDDLDDLKTELSFTGRDIGFTGDSVDVINYAVEMLGPGLVQKEKDFVKPIAILPNVIELNYYANTVITYYALESIVALALTTLESNVSKIYQAELVEVALELCNVFQYEFILCKPCQTMESMVRDCIDNLIIKKQILIVMNETTPDTQRSRRIASEFFDDEEQIEEGLIYQTNTDKESQTHINFLCRLLMPLLEAYIVTAFSLDKLVGRELTENELVKEVLDEMKRRLGEGSIHYEESVSVDPVKNALKLFQKWDILECHTENKLRLYYLKESQDDSECVDALYKRILKFKTELK